MNLFCYAQVLRPCYAFRSTKCSNDELYRGVLLKTELITTVHTLAKIRIFIDKKFITKSGDQARLHQQSGKQKYKREEN